MSNTNFVKWLKAAGLRALRTVAQTAIATIGSAAVLSEINWTMVLSASLVAGILSILMSISGLPEVEPEDTTDTEAENWKPPEDEDE